MRWSTGAAALLWLAVAGTVGAQGLNQNKAGAFLVFPTVVNDRGFFPVETFATVTNVSSEAVEAHVTFFSRDSCVPCALDLSLGPNDSETLVFTRESTDVRRAPSTAPTRGTDARGLSLASDPSSHGSSPAGFEVTRISSLEGTTSKICPAGDGFATVNLQDDAGRTIYEDLLIGDVVIADYRAERAMSIPALAIQGAAEGTGDRRFRFDGDLYRRLPEELRAEFLTPDNRSTDSDPLSSLLVLFSLQFPPAQVDCSVTAYRPDGTAVIRSLSFECQTEIGLLDIDAAFARPLFGAASGSLRVSCETDTDGDGVPDTPGGVHGALLQFPNGGARLRPDGPSFLNAGVWGSPLGQSTATGGTVTLDLEGFEGDLDRDGVADEVDTHPGDPDRCGDTDGDTCDDCAIGTDDFGPLSDADPLNDGPDDDADGLCDIGDNCPTVPNPGQEDRDDADGFGDVCDNCPDNYNPGQEDSDEDGIGDACEVLPGAASSRELPEPRLDAEHTPARRQPERNGRGRKR